MRRGHARPGFLLGPIEPLQAPPQGLVMTGMAMLSGTIVTILLAGRHASLGGQSLRDRAANLAQIASAYSRVELEAEKGMGPARAAEVEDWLEAQGLSLRLEQERSVLAIAGAEPAATSNVEQAFGAEAR